MFSLQALAQGQRKTKSIYAIYSFSRSFDVYRCTLSLVCLLPGNKTMGDPLMRWEFCLRHASADHIRLDYQQLYFKVGSSCHLDRGVKWLVCLTDWSLAPKPFMPTFGAHVNHCSFLLNDRCRCREKYHLHHWRVKCAELENSEMYMTVNCIISIHLWINRWKQQ